MGEVVPFPPTRLEFADLERAKRILESNDPDEVKAWVFTARELKVLGYEKADTVKPGDRFQWLGMTIVVPTPLPLTAHTNCGND